MRGEERAPVDKEMTVHTSADAIPTRYTHNSLFHCNTPVLSVTCAC